MPCAVRLAFIWLLSLAIPFQNVMAAGMAGCAQHEHPVAAAYEQTANHDRGAQGTPSAAVVHDHSSAGTTDQASDHADAAACVLCAGCCTAAALPSAPIPGLPAAAAHFAPPHAPSSTLEIVPARLERPPRSIAA